MTGKIGKVEVYSKRPPSIDFFYALITWQSYHVADGKHYISTSAGPMATKLDRVVGSNTALLSIKSHNLLITWSYKVTWQMKNVINSFPRDVSLSRLFKGIPEFLDSGRQGWTLDSGHWTLDPRLWTLGSGLWTLDSGLWKLGSGRWTLDAGLWTLDSWLWTLDSGRWALNAGLWTRDSESWILDSGHWTLHCRR